MCSLLSQVPERGTSFSTGSPDQGGEEDRWSGYCSEFSVVLTNADSPDYSLFTLDTVSSVDWTVVHDVPGPRMRTLT